MKLDLRINLISVLTLILLTLTSCNGMTVAPSTGQEDNRQRSKRIGKLFDNVVITRPVRNKDV